MAVLTGWIAIALIALTGCVPVVVRLRLGRRAPSQSPPMSTHVFIGLTTGVVAFLHSLLVVPALGEPGAVGGGMIALGAGGLAFFVLVAHTGLGFQLRVPKLRDRVEKRRAHLSTALLVVAAVAVHTVALLAAGR